MYDEYKELEPECEYCGSKDAEPRSYYDGMDVCDACVKKHNDDEDKLSRSIRFNPHANKSIQELLFEKYSFEG